MTYITSGLLDTVNGIIPAYPQVYNPAPQVQLTQPGYVWKRQMFPELVFEEDHPVVKSGVIPQARSITKLL